MMCASFQLFGKLPSDKLLFNFNERGLKIPLMSTLSRENLTTAEFGRRMEEEAEYQKQKKHHFGHFFQVLGSSKMRAEGFKFPPLDI